MSLSKAIQSGLLIAILLTGFLFAARGLRRAFGFR